METKQKSCEERIKKEWSERLKEIKEANRNEEKRDNFIEGILARDEITKIRYCLSYGGPADYIEIEKNKEGEIITARYLFQDWFDGAKIELADEELKEVETLFEKL